MRNAAARLAGWLGVERTTVVLVLSVYLMVLAIGLAVIGLPDQPAAWSWLEGVLFFLGCAIQPLGAPVETTKGHR